MGERLFQTPDNVLADYSSSEKHRVKKSTIPGQLLAYLMERQNRLVTNTQLRTQAVPKWTQATAEGRPPTDATLRNNLKSARQILSDDNDGIYTIFNQGYVYLPYCPDLNEPVQIPIKIKNPHPRTKPLITEMEKYWFSEEGNGLFLTNDLTLPSLELLTAVIRAYPEVVPYRQLLSETQILSIEDSKQLWDYELRPHLQSLRIIKSQTDEWVRERTPNFIITPETKVGYKLVHSPIN